MNKPITVKILVTVNDPAHFDACTLCLETLRVGWPTSDIWVYVNTSASSEGFYAFPAICEKLARVEVRCFPNSPRIHLLALTGPQLHHAEWIRYQVSQNYDGPLIIADPDTVFWKSCEDWEFPGETLLAGYFNPAMWNDFAKCKSQSRIHTSMMVFPDVQKLRNAISYAYPQANQKHGEYCPCDPFMPAVRFIDGKPMFWDSCANLYGMLMFLDGYFGSDTLYHFGEREKACFDHLNSASFHAVMVERMEGINREGFIRAHSEWVKNPVPGLWPLVDAYYKQKMIEGAIEL